jgi:hypothetical protein
MKLLMFKSGISERFAVHLEVRSTLAGSVLLKVVRQLPDRRCPKSPERV